ncbi:tetraacyldisaccharide 4'-kinase [Luteibacter sp. UNCMF366Tsu5.1]|uniref:tetraacyldisaccharide 4'-kinase n=1 Tax=Luteibacter sp. UNCMF366Tsu5.1 TaxID=1502758 RepID=UPI00090876B0|nr:tetraacyldisaccharide 4'-kinase [Luteibacter sp. UNCMF366Tsu5.1]SFW21877.1 lipid-A-disaccharide kinase [Luteibacter sp. UNCMF366Tsu5.1]
MALGASLQRRWYGDSPPPWWTRPLEALYRFAVRRRADRYRNDPAAVVRLPVPVIVVGNITLGGTGKTPLIAALAAAMAERGFKPGVVSRGYGGSERGPYLLTGEDDPARVGDEPSLIRQSGIPVAIGRQRPEAAQLLVEAGCDLILADDGLQHHRLGRDVEICVIDGERRLGNGHLLPAGPLREPASRLADVDFVVVNGGVPGEGEIRMTLEGGVAVNMHDPMKTTPLADFAGRPAHAVAGIGNPARFFASLAAQGIAVDGHPFADHHAFTRDDFTFADGCPVLMTDKDAVKCRRFARPNWWRVPVRAVLPPSFYDAVAARIAEAKPR